MSQRWKFVFTSLALLALYVLAVGMRYAVYQEQVDYIGSAPPYTLESAIQYRMVDTVAEQGALPAHDPMVQYPDGLNYRKTYSLGSEQAYAMLAAWLPGQLPFAEKVRWAALLYFCIGIPLLALYAGTLYRSRGAGWVAGLLYAVCIAGIVRSTGQELSRENFALPFAIAFLIFDIKALRAPTLKQARIFALASGLMLALAQINWDLIQYLIFLWVVAGLIRLTWLNPAPPSRTEREVLTLQAACLLMAACANTYLRTHMFPLSPLMGLLVGLVAACWWPPHAKGAHVFRRALPFVGLFAFMGLGHLYGVNYGHFGELLSAKLKFLNQKPGNPALLTFNQRILWTPALNSSNWALTKAFMPIILWSSLVGAVILTNTRSGSSKPRTLYPVGFFLATLPVYVLFFRFHVFLIIFMALVLAGWMAHATRRQGRHFWVAVAVVALTVVIEAGNVFFDPPSRARMDEKQRMQRQLMQALGVDVSALTPPPRWGRPNTYYRALGELTTWLTEHAAQRPVLANFGVSGSILTYGKCPIVLHPKFERPDIRSRVQAYGEHLFRKDEAGFRQWALDHGARLYVYSMGEFADRAPELQMRYMVDALDPPPEAAARQFETRHINMRYFQFLWGNYKYRVFRIISEEDLLMARSFLELAQLEFGNGNLEKAHERLREALQYDPRNPDVRVWLEKVIRLKHRLISDE